MYKFYRSKEWETLIRRLKIERADSASGVLYCEHCGLPIVRAYDCIAHHVEELTPDNVGNALISLNPSNIRMVHFRCHNEIHKRFGYAERVERRVYVVWGSPCAGKSAWVESVAESGDLILDINRLWTAVRAGCCGEHDKPAELKTNVFGLRDCLLDMIRVRRGKWKNAYIIGGYPLDGERERLVCSMGARDVFIDTPMEICLERSRAIGGEWPEYVREWWDRYTPPSK